MAMPFAPVAVPLTMWELYWETPDHEESVLLERFSSPGGAMIYAAGHDFAAFYEAHEGEDGVFAFPDGETITFEVMDWRPLTPEEGLERGYDTPPGSLMADSAWEEATVYRIAPATFTGINAVGTN